MQRIYIDIYKIAPIFDTDKKKKKYIKLQRIYLHNIGPIFDTRKTFVDEKLNGIPKVSNLDFNLVMKKLRKGPVYRPTTQSGRLRRKHINPSTIFI